MLPIFNKCISFTAADEAKEAGIYPYFHQLESRQDTEVIMEGKRRIMLGSNNYLSLTIHPEVIEAAIKATEKYGTGCSGSRFLNGTLDLHNQLEEELSGYIGFESAVTFSTGFQTNLGIISAIAGRNEYILCDRENHASIYDACRLSYAQTIRYKHNDMNDLKEKLEKLSEDAGKLIITDGVFSMSGDVCKLPEIVKLAKKYNCAVMIDDAHGFGMLGEGGKGTADYFNLTDEVDIVMGTFSKSLASLGGFMVSNERVANYVRHNSRPFIFSASIPPSNCAAAIAALNVIRREPERVKALCDNGNYLRNSLKQNSVNVVDGITPIIPFYTYDLDTTLYIQRQLYDQGVYVNPVLPPAAPPSECLLRCSVMATHTKEQLDEAVEIIKNNYNIG